MEAIGYVELFEQVRARVHDDQVALGILEQVGKDSRVERMRANGVGNGDEFQNGEQPATEKQIGYLRKLGVEIPAGLTKKQASELIDANN